MAEKKAKGPFDGVKDEELREQKAALDALIAEKQSELGTIIRELGARATGGEARGLGDCVKGMQEARQRELANLATAEAAARKALDAVMKKDATKAA
ncbi:MAG: hypothetical protein OEQ39_00165 [Gammaproteobacteria bacterium]|nr:hypothetical protein [Gammaproteobacteria bacterium]